MTHFSNCNSKVYRRDIEGIRSRFLRAIRSRRGAFLRTGAATGNGELGIRGESEHAVRILHHGGGHNGSHVGKHSDGLRVAARRD